MTCRFRRVSCAGRRQWRRAQCRGASRFSGLWAGQQGWVLCFPLQAPLSPGVPKSGFGWEEGGLCGLTQPRFALSSVGPRRCSPVTPRRCLCLCVPTRPAWGRGAGPRQCRVGNSCLRGAPLSLFAVCCIYVLQNMLHIKFCFAPFPV